MVRIGQRMASRLGRKFLLLPLLFVCAGTLGSEVGQHGRRIRKGRDATTVPYYFHIEIQNREFNSSLQNPTSSYHKSLSKEVSELMQMAFNCLGCPTRNTFIHAREMVFRKGDLVIVDMILVFVIISPNLTTSASIVENTFLQHADDYSVLKLNLPYTKRCPAKYMSFGSPIIKSCNVNANPTSATTTQIVHSQRPASTMEPGTFTSELVTRGSNTTALVPNHTIFGSVTIAHETTPGLTKQPSSKPDINHQKGSNKTQTTASPAPPYWLDWVPGWGIALLVLASLILLLVIIILILLLIRWCCMEDMGGDDPRRDQDSNHEPYLSHSPAKTPIIKHMEMPKTPEKPNGSRTGMYVVNP